MTTTFQNCLNRRYINPILLISTALVVFFLLGSMAKKPSETENTATPSVMILPLREMTAAEDDTIAVSFVNTSDMDIHYLEYDVLRPNYLPVAFLEFSLYKGDKLFIPRETPEGPTLDEEKVRTIAPGASVLSEINLEERYGKLDEGLYRLSVKYSIAEGSIFDAELGLTPLVIEKDLLLIRVGGKQR